LLRKGDIAGAMACFQKTAPLSPDPLTRWLSLGGDLLQQGDSEEAIICFREAVKIDATLADAYALLGVALVKNGQIKEAIDAWQQALKIKPDQINALRGLAWVLATAPDASLRNGTRAVALAQQAIQLSGGDSPVLMRTLAAAYAETGRFGDAIATARRASELAVTQHNGALSAKLSQEIKLYEANTPMRDAPP
jgi:tetratricopeptide (TPR) repeat protein